MVTKVFYSLMPQKYINSKKKAGSEIKPYPLYLVNISKKKSQLPIWKEQDWEDMSTIFLLIIILLIVVILSRVTNI